MTTLDDKLESEAQYSPIGVDNSGYALFSIAISLKRIADSLASFESAKHDVLASSVLPNSGAWTRKFVAPTGVSLLDYVDKIKSAVASAGFEVDPTPDGYRVLMFRKNSQQWTQVYRREGNSSTLRVSGPEAGSLVGLV